MRFLPCATCPLCRVLPRPLSTLRQPEPAWLLRAVAGALRGCDPIARRGATDSPLRCARSAAAPLRRRGPDPAGWIARQRGSRVAAQSWASFFVPAGPRTPRPRCSRFLLVWSDFSLIGPGAMPCARGSGLSEPGPDRFPPRPLFGSPRSNPETGRALRAANCWHAGWGPAVLVFVVLGDAGRRRLSGVGSHKRIGDAELQKLQK